MSASEDIQIAVSNLLRQRVTRVLGDGAATVLTVEHGLAMHAHPALAITETATGRVLERDTDYSVAWPDLNTLTVTALGPAPAAGALSAEVARLRVPAPVLERKTGNRANDIAASAANHGLSIFVKMPRVTELEKGVPFVFVKKSEVRVSIMEKPALNLFGADVWDLRDDVMNGLQFLYPALLMHPLYLDRVEEAEGKDAKGQDAREIQVIFTAVYSHATPTAN